jgi:hypothetical protein
LSFIDLTLRGARAGAEIGSQAANRIAGCTFVGGDATITVVTTSTA